MFRTMTISLAATLLAALPAVAAQRGINIPPTALNFAGGAIDNNLLITLPNSGTPGVTAMFTLPNDYRKGTVIKVRLHLTSPDVMTCAAAFAVAPTTRLRPGQPVHLTSERVTVVNGAVGSSSATDVVFTKTVEIRGPTSAAYSSHKPGDTIKLHFIRQSADPADTCIFVNVHMAEVRYTVK